MWDKEFVRDVLRWARLAISVLACAGCAIETPESLGSDLGADAGRVSDFDATPADPTPADAGPDAAVRLFDDVATAVSTVTCKPGTYVGAFSTASETATDGGDTPLFGDMKVTLVALEGAPGPDGAIETTFAVTKFEGHDVVLGAFTADLIGSFNCPAGTLTARMVNGAYTPLGAVVPDGSAIPFHFPMNGTLSARYDGTVSPPIMTGGSIQLVSAPLFHTAPGIWQAHLE